MKTPIRAFWLMGSSIGRIEAEQQRKALEVATCAQDKKLTQELFERLKEQVGEVTRSKPEDPMAARMDRAGFEELRGLA